MTIVDKMCPVMSREEPHQYGGSITIKKYCERNCAAFVEGVKAHEDGTKGVYTYQRCLMMPGRE